MSTNETTVPKNDFLTDDGFFEVDVDTLEEGVRETRGFNNDGKYVRQRDHLSEFGKVICIRVLPHAAESMNFYHQRKTLPFATVPHGWFIHPTRKVSDGKGGEKSHRMFHISPKALGEPDEVEAFLNDEVKHLPGFNGAPEEEVHEIVTIFRSLYTNKDPRYRHLGGPKKDKLTDIAKKIEADYPGYKTAEYVEMAKKIRYIWKIFQYKYLMPMVQVAIELNEEGESVPLTNKGQILDFSGTIKNAIFGKKGGLIEENKKLTPQKARMKKEPFGAYKRFFGSNPAAPAYDIFIECFENRQFVGDDPEKKGYADYNVWFRDVPTVLADGADLYAEKNRYNILEEVRNGIRDESEIIDAFKVHFGMMEPGEFDKLHPVEEKTEEATSAQTEAEEVVQEAKTQKGKPAAEAPAKEAPAAEEEATEEQVDNAEEIEKVTQLIQNIEGMSMPAPEALTKKYKELTGQEWGADAEEVEEEQPKKEAAKKTTKAKTEAKKGGGSSKTRKRADV